MAKLYFKYGSGKSAAICQTAYNYNSYGMYVIIINADNDNKIVSKYTINGKNPLERDVNLKIKDGDLFTQIYYQNQIHEVKAVLIDNSQYLSKESAEELFFVANLLDIPVIAHGDRTISGKTSEGTMRLMELSNVIEEIDEEYVKESRRVKGAKLEFYYGAMNSSKTANLLYKARELEEAGLNVAIMKPSLDRDKKMVTSRIGLQREAYLVVDPETRLYGEGEYLVDRHINYVLIDEAQFFTERQILELRRIVTDYNIPIRCYGLKVDFLSHHFTGSGKLLEEADTLKKLRTICKCTKGAIFNARINSNGTYATSGDSIVIDNGANYISLCPNCFIDNVMIEEKNKILARVKK